MPYSELLMKRRATVPRLHSTPLTAALKLGALMSAVLLLGCSAPQSAFGEASAIDASASAAPSLSGAEAIGRWASDELELELRADGTYAWSRPEGVEFLERVPPIAQEGFWTLHSSAADASGVARAGALRLGPDGTAGKIVPILGSASQPVLELIPGALTLARQ